MATGYETLSGQKIVGQLFARICARVASVGAFTLCASLCPTMFLLLHTLRLLRASQSSRPEFEVLLLAENRNKLKNKYSLLFSLLFSLSSSLHFFYDCCQCWQLVSGGRRLCQGGWAVWGNNYAVNLTEIFQLKGNEINSNQIRQSIYHSRAGESLTHTRPHPHPLTHTDTDEHTQTSTLSS